MTMFSHIYSNKFAYYMCTISIHLCGGVWARDKSGLYSLARQNKQWQNHHRRCRHSCNNTSVCERIALANARWCALLCGFSALASSGYIWCDGGNKTYFGLNFQDAFRSSTTCCVCAMRPRHFICVLKQRFPLCEL